MADNLKYNQPGVGANIATDDIDRHTTQADDGKPLSTEGTDLTT